MTRYRVGTPGIFTMLYYVLVFIAALLVDLVPFIGPPAWTVMVFFQMRYHLNIWMVLIMGVTGSTLGRYLLSRYIPWLSMKLLTKAKNEDLQFIGERLAGNGRSIQFFVLIYTLVPLPSTPLFTAAGIAKIKPVNLLPAFFVGKFISDMVMVLTGNYVAVNAKRIVEGFLNWKSIAGTVAGLIILCLFMFIDWHQLLQQRKLRLRFNVWK
jgi:membrane protein DedA with SNARE-associated domain